MKITVLGATGGIGQAIAKELVVQGHDVVGTTRGTDTGIDGVHTVSVDLQTTVPSEATRGSDVVIMAAQPPYPQWVAEWPGMLDRALAGAESADAKFVFVDNLYMYAPATGPLTPESPEHATTKKGALRRRLGQRVLDAHRSGQVRTTIGRFSDYYGPAGTN